MKRPPVSIIIPVWNAWPHTKLCLDSLRTTIGVQDEVIVVNNGSTDATANGLKSYSWVKVITNDENLGFAKANNQGFEIAKHDLLLFLNNDTAVPKGAIDALLHPLIQDESVGATGPRSNYVSGDQIVTNIEYAETRNMTDFRAFAKKFMSENAGQTTPTQRLVGFCIAVKRQAFEAAGRWDERYGIGGYEDDDLSKALIDNGYQLLICHDSFVHHSGHQTFDENKLDRSQIERDNAEKFVSKISEAGLISACIIARDESANIADCIDSVKGFADEVVVYDTGSSDNTREIAAEHGATVIEGYWDDDFGRARNAALEKCTSDWILHIDADERLDLPMIETVRSFIARAAERAFVVPITNHNDAVTGGDISHKAVRLFKRVGHQWEGRLHERVVRTDGQPMGTAGALPYLQLHHYGYSAEAMQTFDKTNRNLRLAKADVDEGEGDLAYKKLNLARSLMLANNSAEAIDHLVDARNIATRTNAHALVKQNILRTGVEAWIATGRVDEASEWIDALSNTDEPASIVNYLRAQVEFTRGNYAAAVAGYESIDTSDSQAFTYAKSTLFFRKGLAYEANDQLDLAYLAIKQAVVEGYNGPIWPQLVRVAQNSTADLEDCVKLANKTDVVAAMGQLVDDEPENADAFAEAYWDAHPAVPHIVAFAAVIAPKLSPMRAMEWSVRLRQAGFEDNCPLIIAANNQQLEVGVRCQFAILAYEQFKDERVFETSRIIGQDTEDANLLSVLSLLIRMSHELVEPFLTGAAQTIARCLILAKAMLEISAREAAAGICIHALTTMLPTTDQAELGAAKEMAHWISRVGLPVESTFDLDGSLRDLTTSDHESI